MISNFPASPSANGSIPRTVYAVVVTYGDRRHLVNQLVERILESDRRPDHLVLVENAPQEPSPLSGPEGWMTILRLPKNIGSSGGYHHGIERAIELGADAVWCLDDDNIPEKDCLENLLAHSDPSRKRIVVANRPVRQEFGKAVLSHAPGLQSHSFMGFSIFPSIRTPSSSEDPDLLETHFFGYGGALVPRQAILEGGLPDPSLFLYHDDSEWSWRLREAGWKAFLMPGAVIHDVDLPWGGFSPNGASPLFSCTVPELKLWYCVRNRAYLERKMGFNGPIHTFNFILWLFALEAKTFLVEWNPKHLLKTCRTALSAFQQGSRGVIGDYAPTVAGGQ